MRVFGFNIDLSFEDKKKDQQQVAIVTITARDAFGQARLFSISAIADKVLEQISDDHLKELMSAVDEGDGKSFVQLSGGPTAARKDQPLRPLHIQKETPNMGK